MVTHSQQSWTPHQTKMSHGHRAESRNGHPRCLSAGPVRHMEWNLVPSACIVTLPVLHCIDMYSQASKPRFSSITLPCCSYYLLTPPPRISCCDQSITQSIEQARIKQEPGAISAQTNCTQVTKQETAATCSYLQKQKGTTAHRCRKLGHSLNKSFLSQPVRGLTRSRGARASLSRAVRAHPHPRIQSLQ